MSGPTFVAKFADGEVTRMTCHCQPQHLDPAQGLRMSRAAYEIRIRNRRRAAARKTRDPLIDAPWPCDDEPVAIPKIVKGWFEAGGKKLTEYSGEKLAEIIADKSA